MIIRHLIFLFFLFSLSPLSAQTNPKVTKTLKKVSELVKKNRKAKAIQSLESAIVKFPDAQGLYLALSKLHLDDKAYDKALPNLMQLARLSPGNPKVQYTLYQSHKALGQFDLAESALSKVIELSQENKKQLDKILKEKEHFDFYRNAINNPVEFNPIKLDEKINSEHHEYLPSIAFDGTMIFTRRIGGQEDIFLSSKDSLGQYQLSSPVSNLNTPSNEGAHCLSVDGNTLILSLDSRRDGKGRFDLYISEKQNGEWSDVKNMGSNINSSAWDAQPTLSADGSELFFTSDRKGGVGGKDIYMSKRNTQGKWSKAELLDTMINTKGNEASPFIHPDNSSLYFRSDYWPGMGDFDIYLSKKDGNTWTRAKNLGYPINTELSEGALFVDVFGEKAYFASDRESGNLDIFVFDLPNEFRPNPVTYLEVTVLDMVTDQPLKASIDIQYFDADVNYTLETRSDGTAVQVLYPGSTYAISVTAPGYLLHSEHIDLIKEASITAPFQYIVRMQRIPGKDEQQEPVASAPIVLNNIFFESGSYNLLPESDYEMKKLLEILKDNPNSSLNIIGHTDNVGSEDDNLLLSQQRARSVKNRLVALGADSARVSYEGKGESEPIATNDTAMGRRQNRRTEFTIINR